jgi:hypothetical protein
MEYSVDRRSLRWWKMEETQMAMFGRVQSR